VRNNVWRSSSFVVFAAIVASLLSSRAVGAAESTVLSGSIAGAEYTIEVPQNWNGTLLLFSHGAVAPGGQSPRRSATTSRCWIISLPR
jgi:hypothetical protein